MFSPKTIPPRDKTPFLVRSLETREGLEPSMLLDDDADEPEAKEAPVKTRMVNGSVPATTDLLIKGLMDRLPKPNSTWSLEDRSRWLQTAASIFDLIYEAEGEKGDITVTLAKDAPLSSRRNQ